MKRIIVVLISIICIGIFCSCSENLELYVNENMSDLRYYIFDGESEKFFATATFGEREEPYFLDGVSNDNIEFGIIEVMFFEKQNFELLSCELKINNEQFDIVLEKNPITLTYMCDIEKVYEETAKIEITINNKSLTLTNQTNNWQIDYSKALQIGINTFQSEIKENKKNNQPQEFYLKIIGKANSYDNKYFYWCFSVKGENISKSCAIDVNTGEVLTKT